MGTVVKENPSSSSFEIFHYYYFLFFIFKFSKHNYVFSCCLPLGLMSHFFIERYS